MIRRLFSTLILISTTVAACSASPRRINDSAPQQVGQEAAVAPTVVFPLPASLSFAGERVPLENFDTRESLSREIQTNAYVHSRTLLTIIATTRYFPIIEPIMKRHGIPDDFKYLCVAESALNPNVVSSASAGGLWQLMSSTAKEQGLFTGGGVDERFHIEKSTEAACRYLLAAKEKFGSWTLAAAAYNAGQAGVSRRMELQGVDDYYDLFLPEETLRYVFRILALKLIIESPEDYGFFLTEADYMMPLDNYTETSVSGANIDWSAEAKKHGTTYKMLRELNHWIRDYKFQGNAARTFKLKVPGPGFRN